MYQATSPPPTDLESKGSEGDGQRNLPQSAPTKNHPSSPGWLSPGESDGGDSSWPLFSMYCRTAEEEDNKMIERYQKEADGILIFASLFTAAVSASATVSIQDLRPNSEDTSAFYLKAIYQLLANPNASQATMSSSLATPPAFSPPAYAIWTNSLWFLSMACSLLSAMLAMALRQWTRRYVMAIQQPWFTPDQRARVRETFTNHPHRSHLLWVTFPMASFLCLSIVLYVIGGLVFLFNLNRIVFSSGALCAVHGAVLYVCYTAASIFKPQILFYTPFASLVLRICFGVWDIALRVSSCIPPFRRLCDNSRRCYRDLSLRYHEGLLKGKCRAVEETASKRSSEIDLNVLEWTFDYVVEDTALQQFFGAIPGFFDSKLVNNLQGRLSNRFRTKLRQALNGFLDHTFSPNAFTGSVRADRLVICLNAARTALGSGAVSQILGDIFDGRWPTALQSVEVGHALKHCIDTGFSSHIRRIVARIISRVQVGERDDRWISLVQDEFGIPGRALREHVARRDSASLAILIQIIRQLLHTDFPLWEPDILREFSNFDIHDTLPTQQHDFCTTWNKVIREAQSRGAGSTPDLILKEIGHIFTALHHATSDAVPVAYPGSTARGDNILPEPLSYLLPEPLSYPFCCVVDHRLDSTPDPHPDQGSVGDASHALSPLSEVPDAMPSPAIFPTPSQPVPPGDPSAAAAEISAISRTVNTIHFPAFGVGSARRKAQETEPPIPSSTGFDSPLTSTPSSMLSLHSRPLHPVHPASVDAIVTRSDSVNPTPGMPFSSLSDAARQSISPHVSTFSDQSATLGVGGAGTPNDTRGLNPPIAMEVSRHPPMSVSSAPNIPANALRHDSNVQHKTSD